MPLSEDRNTRMKGVDVMVVPVAAGAKIYAGALVVANATGFAAPGIAALNLTYLGRADDAQDNTGGIDGALSVTVRRPQAFSWKNSAADPIGQAQLGKQCFIEDDETVSATDAVGTRSPCGLVVRIDSNGVWVA